MTDQSTPIETLLEKAEDYSKTTIELFKLNAIDKSADVLSSLISRTVVILAMTLFILIANIGLALWLGELLGKSYFGFFVIAAFYGCMAILLKLLRHRWLKTPISNTIIRQLLKQKVV